MPHAIRKENFSRKRNDAPAIAVTAASGKLGHAMARAIAAEGLAQNTRLVARDPNRIRLDGLQQFDVVAGDYENGRSMAAALSGIDTAFIISSMGPDTTRVRQHRIAIDAAIAAGVKRIIYTSSTAANLAGPMQWTSAHTETEHYLRQCGMPYTVLRVGVYFSNFDYLYRIAMECGRLFFPTMTQPISLISQEDVAAASIRVLTTPGHEKKTYELLAKNAISMNDLAQLMTHLLGARVIGASVPVEAFVTQLRKQPIPAYAADMLGGFYAAITAGACARTSKDIEMLTGRPAISAAAYLDAFMGTKRDGG